MILLETLSCVLALVVLVPALVFFIEIAMAFTIRPTGEDSRGDRPRVAVLVPAHDEEAGIVLTVRNVREQLVAGDRVIVQNDQQQGSFLAAFDASDGRELWRTARDSKPSWSTPTIVEGPKRTELVANGVEHVCGYDAETGRELWRLKGTSMISVPTPFVANGLIYVFSGYSRYIRRSYAIRPGASGDITASKESIAWMREEAPYLSTPVIVGDQLFTYSTRGRWFAPCFPR